jgi:integrase
MSRPRVLQPTAKVRRTSSGYEVRWNPDFDVAIVDEAPWNVRVSLGKRFVVLRQKQKGAIQLDLGFRGKGGRISTGKQDLNEAIAFAEAHLMTTWASALWEQRGPSSLAPGVKENLTLADAITLCRKFYIPKQTAQWAQSLERVFDTVLEIFGGGFPLHLIGDSFVRNYIERRTSDGIAFKRVQRLELAPCQPCTALGDVKDFAAAIRTLCKVPDGDPVLAADPFRNVTWPDGEEFEKRYREPASVELYEVLMAEFTDPKTGERLPAPVDVIDPSGALRWLVAVLFHTGHRLNSCLNLRAGHIVTDLPTIRQKLHEARGAHRAQWAKAFAVHGAIWFDGAHEKGKRTRLVPMSLGLHLEWIRYTTLHGEWAPSDVLMPAVLDATRPMSKSTLCKTRYSNGVTEKKGGRYREALYLAREYLARAGRDPDDIAPMVKGEFIHGWRRCFATTLRDLGWGNFDFGEKVHLERHVNFLGGWSILGGHVREERYVRLDAELLLAAVNFRPVVEVLKVRGESCAARIMQTLERTTGGALEAQKVAA